MGEKNREVPGFNQELEEYRQIKEVVAEYPVTPYSLRREGNAWAMETDAGPIRVEKFRHSLPEFFFVLSAVGFLRDRGLGSLPKLFNNRNGQPVTEQPNGLFCVIENPSGRVVDAREIDVLTGITRHLAELHRTSVGYTPPPLVADIRQDWGDWEEKWQYRLDELYRLGEEAQHHKGEFEHLYLKVLDDFIQDGVDGLEQLKSLGIRAIVEEERLRGGLCQRDYKPANLLEHKDGYWLRDFDDFAGQSHLEDIARFIKEVGDWEPDRIRYIFEVYSQVYALSETEKEAVKAYLKLPLDLWKVARNHYLRGKPQKSNLKAVIQEMTKRKRCFNQLEDPRHSTRAVGHLPWVWGLPAETPPPASLDQYWGRWDWGNNWQAVGGSPSPVAANETINQGEVSWNWAAYPGMTPDQGWSEKPTETLASEGVCEMISGDDDSSKSEELEMSSEDKDIDLEMDAKNDDISFPEPEPETAITEEEEVLDPVVSDQPKILIWKAFPKPLA